MKRMAINALCAILAITLTIPLSSAQARENELAAAPETTAPCASTQLPERPNPSNSPAFTACSTDSVTTRDAAYPTGLPEAAMGAELPGEEEVPAPIDISEAKVKLSTSTFTYSGTELMPHVKAVKLSGSKLPASGAYTVSYRDNVKPGRAQVTVTGRGAYTGSAMATFTILPKSTNITSVVPLANGLKVSWKMQAKQTSGYQLQCSTTRGFKAAKTKTLSIAKARTTSKKLTHLKPGKRYYLRMRTFKTVANTKYYSPWSTSKWTAKTQSESKQR